MNNIKLLIVFWNCVEYADFYNSTFFDENIKLEDIDKSVFEWVEANWGIKRIIISLMYTHTYEIVDKDKFTVFLLSNSEYITRYD